jgi:hypothetical protein
MFEGFWIVQFEGLAGGGGGVAVFIKGRIFGGDSAYSYLGKYQTVGNSIKAQVSVHNFLPGIPSVVGITGNFELQVEGTLKGNVIEAKGSLPSPQQTAGLVVRLTRRADLPG